LRRQIFQNEIYEMALHRDIFWVGKQWAVTGYGMQAVDQKQKSKFDIEASRVWEDDLLEVLSEQRWFNAEDFSAGLSVARAKYPEPPAMAAARKARESVRVPVVPPKAEPNVESKVTAKAEPLKPDTKARVAAKPQPANEAAKLAVRVAAPKQEAAPPPPKAAIASGPAQTIKVKSRPAKRRPVAQINMRIGSWPAKFTRMWRIRVNAQ
jgi:hypothetical protein